jgi:hypothetical protein
MLGISAVKYVQYKICYSNCGVVDEASLMECYIMLIGK